MTDRNAKLNYDQSASNDGLYYAYSLRASRQMKR